jgi:fumarate hydratase class II
MKAEEFKDITNGLKVGRTHTQDAVSVTLGQNSMFMLLKLTSVLHSPNIRRIKEKMSEVCELAQGGTAVGTGLTLMKASMKE